MKIIDRVTNKLKREGILSLTIAVFRWPFNYRRRLAYQKMLELGTTKQRFSEIYQSNFWNSQESGSGRGSELDYTERLRSWLLLAIPKYNIKRIVDAPCGDFNWMKYVIPNIDIEYFGFDIVESVIEKNSKEYSTQSVHFGVADICEDKLPKSDLLIVRDCLFHLSYEDIDKFLKNISDVDYKYLLTTTYVSTKISNKNITTGDFRRINLLEEPFNFEGNSILERVEDYPLGYSDPREMILIEKSNVPISMTY